MSQRDIAAAAGVSRQFLDKCRAVGEIPHDEFERLVEAEDFQGVGELVRIGRAYRKGEFPAESPARKDKPAKCCPHCGGAL